LKIESDLQNAMQRLQAANQSVTAHEEVFRLTTEMFNAGRISTYEHLLARQRLANSQSQAAQAKFDLAYKLIVYEYYHKQ
jgi:outer membrane protein